MIPAILSCVFVLYLYRTLNSPDEQSEDASSGQTNLSDRLDDLQKRLNQIANQSKRGQQP